MLPKLNYQVLNGIGNQPLISYILPNQENKQLIEPHQLLQLKVHYQIIMSIMEPLKLVAHQHYQQVQLHHSEDVMLKFIQQFQEHQKQFQLELMDIPQLQDIMFFMEHVLKPQERLQLEILLDIMVTLIMVLLTHLEFKEYFLADYNLSFYFLIIKYVNLKI